VETIEYKYIDGVNKFNKNELMLLVLGSVSDSVWDADKIDVAKIKMVISAFVDSPDTTKRVAIVAQDNGKAVGLIAGTITDDGLLGKPMASELMWYVSKEYRKSKIATTLISMFEKWARGNGIDYLTMSHYNNDLGDILGKVFEKRGFKKMEVTYFKELK
jgi:GNAT superfamily N-acetyltransferase